MKLLSTFFFAAVVTSSFHGVSAEENVSLRGVMPEKEALLEYLNCDTKEDCPRYGVNTCTRIDQECNGQCFWDGNSCRFDRPIRNCIDYQSRFSCEDNNCDWINNRCRDPTNRCSNIGNRNTCLDRGCDWVNNRCLDRSTNIRCSDYDRSRNACVREGCSFDSRTSTCSLVCEDFDFTSFSTCERSGLCTWDSSSRSCSLTSCSGLDDTSRSECENAGSCIWNSNRRACSQSGVRCSDYDRDRNTCEREGCSFDSSSRNCRLICQNLDRTSEGECEASGHCTWDRSRQYCNLTRECDSYTNRDQCVNTNPNCVWQSSNRSCRLMRGEAALEEEEEE